MNAETLHDVKVLVVDDDPQLRALIATALAETGAVVSTAATGEEALRALAGVDADVVVLDVMMPGMDGFQVCVEIGQRCDVPVILLTALGSDDEIVHGLACGAIDYVTKPFSLQVLQARIEAAVRHTRRSARKPARPVYDDGYLQLDLDQRKAMVDGAAVALTPLEWGVLECLTRAPGQVVPVEEILEAVWGADYRETLNYVHVYISRLRSKFDGGPDGHEYFANERGVGYRFVPKV